MYALLNGEPHQVMPGGMKLNLVSPAPKPVVSAQDRRAFVGERAALDGFRGSQRSAESVQSIAGPSRAFAHHGFTQRPVG